MCKYRLPNEGMTATVSLTTRIYCTSTYHLQHEHNTQHPLQSLRIADIYVLHYLYLELP